MVCRLEEALQDYGRAIELDSGPTLSLHSRALLLERLSQLPAALADYDRWVCVPVCDDSIACGLDHLSLGLLAFMHTPLLPFFQRPKHCCLFT